jgi:hypothetical protein
MIPVDGGDVLQQGVVERPTQFAQHQGGRDVSMADRGHEPADLAPLGSYMPPSDMEDTRANFMHATHRSARWSRPSGTRRSQHRSVARQLSGTKESGFPQRWGPLI